MSLRIGVIAEGEREIGTLDLVERGIESGVTFTLMRRLLRAGGEDVSFEPIKISRLRRLDRAPRGERETASLGFREALRRGCMAVFLFRDDDAKARRAENRAGLADAAAAHPDVPWVLGMQINTLEAWLLGEGDAFERAFGRVPDAMPDHPEDLWGAVRDATSNHPKQVYRRVLRELGIKDDRATALRIAAEVELEELAETCPAGFGQFFDDARRVFRAFDCVVAVDAKLGIGRDNDLPWPKLRSDLKHLRTVTTQAPEGKRNAVIMGRRTWDSTPERFRPLPGRLNIVISRQAPVLPDGVLAARSLDHALNQASLASDVERIFVLGGGQIFNEAFAHFRCGAIYLTRIDGDFAADTHVPDPAPRFELAEVMARHNEAGFDYTIERWLRRRPGT